MASSIVDPHGMPVEALEAVLTRSPEPRRETPPTGLPIADPLGAVARAAGDGDASAAQRVARAVAPVVYRVVRAVLGADHPDLDDHVQDALVGFMDALATFRAECTVAQFASRIAARRAIAARRRTRAVRNWLGFHARTEEPLQHSPGTPSEDVVAARRKQLVRTLLTELPEVQAEAIALHIVLGYSIEEVAVVSGAPVNTVRSRLRLAKDAMRRRLEKDPALAALAEREEEG